MATSRQDGKLPVRVATLLPSATEILWVVAGDYPDKCHLVGRSHECELKWLCMSGMSRTESELVQESRPSYGPALSQRFCRAWVSPVCLSILILLASSRTAVTSLVRHHDTPAHCALSHI